MKHIFMSMTLLAAEDRIGIGTLGMRHEAKENHFHIGLTPRLGGGTTATLVVPLHRQAPEVVPSSGARKMA